MGIHAELHEKHACARARTASRCGARRKALAQDIRHLIEALWPYLQDIFYRIPLQYVLLELLVSRRRLYAPFDSCLLQTNGNP